MTPPPFRFHDPSKRRVLARLAIAALVAAAIAWAGSSTDAEPRTGSHSTESGATPAANPETWPEPIRETASQLRACSTMRCVIRRRFGRHAAAATRVAWCESRLRPRAVSSTGDYGLFQINRHYHGWAFDGHDIFDPAWNAFVAYRLSKGGTDWRPWACGWAA